MQLKFEISCIDYIIAKIYRHNNNQTIGHSSDQGDKFQELLNVFFQIDKLNESADKQQLLPFSSMVWWYNDFINYCWHIQTSDGFNLNIEIVEHSPENEKYQLAIVSEYLTLDTLLLDIYKSLREMWMKFGFVGYKMNWSAGNFPIYELLTLKSRFSDIKLTFLEQDEENEWRYKVRPEEELQLLLKN
ncbi:hypothetical protein DVR12_17780 [Chitinophaga silvatica]|uniref:Uncharacterized protein n=1 Tax=Chitinophaga silvatica TaxID=2282649 RepID=A0A3E1Y7Y7_9BACT|nr:hypothetical protein [Chitinophaga silvatica]RFS21184.1 hypothetical protein DVR12_17780 [Chitinophaga silvatica]